MAETTPNRTYDDRLTQGDVVYLAEGKDPHRPHEGALMTKKATVLQDCRDGRTFAVVKRWPDPDTPPERTGIATGFDPSELFTELELAGEVSRCQDTHGHLGEMTMRGILRDPAASEALATILQQAIQARATVQRPVTSSPPVA